MSREHFSDVLGAAEPLASIIDSYGLPPVEGDLSRFQNPAVLALGEKLGLAERPKLVARETEQATAHQESAYLEFIKTTEGTPEYYQALEAFILLLFPDCSPPTNMPTEAQRLDAPPSHGG